MVCVGAANALANPKRLLKALPGALYEVGTAVTVSRTRYRPDRWRGAELLVVVCGLVPAAVVYLTRQVDAAALYPATVSWPELALVPTVAVLVAALPAALTPPPPRAAARRVHRGVKVA